MITVLISLLVAVSARYGAASDSLLQGVQKAYETITDIKGSFVQKSHIKDLKRTDAYKGAFIIKMPSKMRWNYSGDNKESTEIIVRNNEIVIYQKSERQAFKGNFDKESYGQAPIAFLNGFGTIDKEFDSVEKDGKIYLKPKKAMGGVVSVEITPSAGEFPIGSLTIVDRRSNRVEILFKDVAVNTGIKDSAFDFTLPQGTSVYEYAPPR